MRLDSSGTVAAFTALYHGSHAPHAGHFRENLWDRSPLPFLTMCWTTTGVLPQSLSDTKSSITPHDFKSSITRLEAESPRSRAIGYDAQPRNARAVRTF